MNKFKIPKNKISVGHKIKLYPTESQALFLDKCIDVNRKVYNWTIERQNEHYQQWLKGLVKNKFLRFEQLESLFYEFRNNNSYLLEVPCTSARNAIIRAMDGFKRFYKGETNFPKFKSKKRSKKSYTTNGNRMYFQNDKVRIEGLPKGEMINIRFDTNLTKKSGPKYFYSPVITKIPSGDYILSYITFEDFPKENINKTEPIGIDINKNNITLSNGTVYYTPKKNKELKKIKKYQRKYNHKLKCAQKITNSDEVSISKRALKTRLIITKNFKKIHDKNENFIHAFTSDVVKLNPSVIIMETLKVSDMKKKHYMAKQIQYYPFYRCIEVMKYKAYNNGIIFIQAPLEYESSKICSSCGNIKNIYGNKRYICPNCGLKIDRDLNAAINLSKLA